MARSPAGQARPASRRWKSPAGRKPPAPRRRYAGTSHIDADSTSAAQAKEIVASLAEKNLTVSGLGYYPNPLHPDAAHREAVIGHLKKVIVLAANMGVPVVNTFCGGDASKTVDVNWQDALDGLARNRRPCARPRRQARLRELPDDLQL